MAPATVYFLKVILPLLVGQFVVGLLLLWFPWRRIFAVDAKQKEESARDFIRLGSDDMAARVFQRAYGLTPEHAAALIAGLKQKEEPNQRTTAQRALRVADR